MVLSDKDIKSFVKKGIIRVTPKPNFSIQLGSCSLDLRLGDDFRVFEHSKNAYLDPTKKDYTNEVTRQVKIKKGESFIMQPGDFVLAVTMERIKIPDDLLGRLEGRSSLGRLGIVVHSTASVFDPGWDGQCVLGLGNLGRMPVSLYPGMRICAMTFEQLSTPSTNPYTKKKLAKYKFQNGPQESRYSEDK